MNKLFIPAGYYRFMIVSHRHRFVFFPNPLDGSAALMRAFAPFGDQEILTEGARDSESPFSVGMSPHEAEWAFDALGLAYRSYMRVCVVENPFHRLVRLYDQIAATDPFWIARKRAGLGQRDFTSWVSGVRPDGWGAGGRTSPRWRRFGAWSADNWCGAHASLVIRQHAIEEDIVPVLSALGIAPSFDSDFADSHIPLDWERNYTDTAIQLVIEKYSNDLKAHQFAALELPKAS